MSIQELSFDGAARVALVFFAFLLSASQSAPGQERPNVLFCIADDWSHGHASGYGCQWVETPSFDRIAREGVLFNNCFTSNPKCSPCRASILTGRNTWQLEEACCHYGIFPAKWPVYPDLLEAAGYHVGYTGKGWGPGDARAGGFNRNPAGTAYNEKQARPPHRSMSGNDYAANFVAFLEDRREGQPFCFWYGASEPHRAYEPGIGRQAGKNVRDVDLPAYYPDSNVIREDFLDYAVEVEWFDAHLGRILEHLEEIGELDRTLIVVTSDHGAPFPRIKGQVYEHGFHLPLAIRWAGHVQAGRVVDDFINVRDFMPTFLDAAGIERPESVTGESFLDVLESDASGWVDRSRNRMLIGKERHDVGRPYDWGYPVRAIRTPEYLYIHNYEPDRWPVGNPETGYRNCDASPTKDYVLRAFNEHYRLCFGMRPREELYRIADDPDCVHNLAESGEHRAAKENLRDEMEQLLREEGDPRMFGRGEIFESYRYLGGDGHRYETWLKFRQ